MIQHDIITKSFFCVSITLLTSNWSSKLCHHLTVLGYTVIANNILSLDNIKNNLLQADNQNCGVITFLCSSAKELTLSIFANLLTSFFRENNIYYFSILCFNVNEPSCILSILGPSIVVENKEKKSPYRD